MSSSLPFFNFELLVLFGVTVFEYGMYCFHHRVLYFCVYSSRRMSTTEGWKILIVVLCLISIFRKDTYGVFSEPVDSRLVGINLLITIIL